MLPPGSTIGILGGGQLGRMLAVAAADLGMHCHILAPEQTPPAAQISNYHTCADFDDINALKSFAKSVDVITYEFENISAEPLHQIKNLCLIRPSLKSLKISQDRLLEKRFVQKLGYSTTLFNPVDNERDLSNLLLDMDLPAILKTRRFGYDGKGQHSIPTKVVHIVDWISTQAVWKSFGEVPSILERFVKFSQEFAVVVARDKNGKSCCFDAIATYHKDGILDRAKCPSGLHPTLEAYAKKAAVKISEALEHIGVLTVEFFLLGDINDGTNASKRILINEIAPRVHNSGHLTRESFVTCQFEQHIRAICGWPLGKPKRIANATMKNLLGDSVNNWETHAKKHNTHITLYGKGEARTGRKMGHFVQVQPISR